MGNCNLLPAIKDPIYEQRERILELKRIGFYSEQTPSGTDRTVSSFLSFGTRALASKHRRKASREFQSKESLEDRAEANRKTFLKKASITTNDLESTSRATPPSKSMSIYR